MKGFYRFFIVIICCLTTITMLGQNNTIKLNFKEFSEADKEKLNAAEELYIDLEYQKALPLYEELKASYPEEDYISYRLGMCYLEREDSYQKAVETLKPVAEKFPESADIKFYLGKAYHLNYQFDEAIKELNEYLGQKIIKSQRPITERLIQNCENAKKLVENPIEVDIANIGAPINSDASEYVPVVSSDEKVMIFTYMGEKSKRGMEDVFRTEKKKDGTWKTPKPLGDNINGIDHDASIAISPDGQKLFVYRDDPKKKGEIYYSELKGKRWDTPKPLLGDVNSNHWEGSCSLSADGKTLYFTSDKPEGFGGRDIYKATLINDSIWGNVENLGATINTPYNDDAPFFHPDGRTLVFSSEGHNSMGGYDVFHTRLKDDGTWKAPENIGHPINSPDRDTYYVLSADGKTGYFSSGRAGGQGKQDIYTVVPGLVGYKPAVAMVSGMVTLNNKPYAAEITVNFKDNKRLYTKTENNTESGEYLTTLPSSHEYVVEYKLKDFDFSKLKGDSIITKTLTIAESDTMVKMDVNIKFFTDSFIVEENKKITETNKKTKAKGLIFKVQIAAYSFPKNYDHKRLKGLGKVEELVLEDNITRFTIGGEFKTFEKASKHNEKVKARGQTDAFITAIYEGKRVYLQDLIDKGIFKKPEEATQEENIEE
ncbi:MAG: tetratricopeptide repeat protein [Vicingaceae bacterium]